MDCKSIVIEWLKNNGADGLCHPDDECGCGLDDDFAACCDGPRPGCKPAKMRVLAENEYLGDGGPGDIAYFVMPNVRGKAQTRQRLAP